MPHGYTQDRTFAFEDGSVLTASHVVTFSNGTVYNKVTMKGEGFKSDSPVINNGVKTGLATSAIFFPHENGMMGRGQLVSKSLLWNRLQTIAYFKRKRLNSKQYYCFKISDSFETVPMN